MDAEVKNQAKSTDSQEHSKVASSQVNAVKNTNLTITAAETKNNLESKVKTVVARDKATGKKVRTSIFLISIAKPQNVLNLINLYA